MKKILAILVVTAFMTLGATAALAHGCGYGGHCGGGYYRGCPYYGQN